MLSNRYGCSESGEFWFGIAGELADSATPLVLVHGGPGFPSYYLEPLLPLQRVCPLVFWDQAGCGRSRPLGNRKSFSIDSFVQELEALRLALGVEKMHLLGHSFGGLIIGEYALAFKERVASALFVSASLDIPRWREDADRLRATLPLMSKMVLSEGQRTGNFFSTQYLAALALYNDRFVYRFEQKPEIVARSEAESDSTTYRTVWGPNEIVVTGVVKDYSLSARLAELSVPAIFMCGRYDEATPEAHEYFASLVAGARCVIFEDSAHHPHINETAKFCSEVELFLGGVISQLR